MCLLRNAIVAVILLVPCAAVAFDTVVADPVVVLNASGHTAAVNRVRFSADGRSLISVSSDKCVRIWNLATGESELVLRPPVGAGHRGVLYALAVSPDGKRLAMGGYGTNPKNHDIYLLDTSNFQVAGVLCGHTNAVVNLVFSPDGRTLASTSTDSTARLWDVEGRRCKVVLRGHAEEVYAAAFHPAGRRLATASLDGSVRIWEVRRGIQELAIPSSGAAACAVDWNTEGDALAVGYVDQTLKVWSSTGRLRRQFQRLGNAVTSVRFLRRSNRLLYTLGGSDSVDGAFVIDLDSNREELSFEAHADSVLDCAVSPDESLAATADADGDICVWSTRTGQLRKRIASAGERAWRVAWQDDGRAIAWGTLSEYRDDNHRGPLTAAFDLKELQRIHPGQVSRGAVSQVSATRIKAASRQQLDVTHYRGQARLTLPRPHDVVRCYSLLGDGAAVVGSDFGLWIYDTFRGTVVRRLAGHHGAVWAVAPSPDGRHLLSAGDDRTLRIWDWKHGRLLASLFVAGPHWIAWTPDGKYAASPGGESLMGWQLNQEGPQLSKLHPAASFRDSLYQPDILRQLLDEPTKDRALSSEFATGGIANVLPPEVRITSPAPRSRVEDGQVLVRAVARSVSGHAIRDLRLLLDGRPLSGQKAVRVEKRDPGPAVDGMHDGSTFEWSAEWEVSLSAGEHRLAAVAETSVSKGRSDEIIVHCTTPSMMSARLPNLYVFAVGIAEYPGALQLKHAARDAQAISLALEQAAAPLYEKVHVRTLVDRKADRRQILLGLSWLRRQMTQRDVAVFFFSGHGAKNAAGSFFLVPVDGEPNELAATAVSDSQLKAALASIPGRVVAMLDACHAGAASAERRKGVSVLSDNVVRDLVTDDYGVVVMCSSMGREYSRESDERRQGYFTLALVESLRGQADYNRDGLVHLTEIDAYVSDRVKALTQGRQHPVTAKPTTVRSFPLGSVKSRGGPVTPSRNTPEPTGSLLSAGTTR